MRIYTTQQTSKKYKAAQLIGFFIMAVAVVVTIGRAQGDGNPGGDPQLPMSLIFFLGMLTWIGAKVLAWWHHG